MEAGETFEESTGHTGSEVRAVAFRGSPSDLSCFLGHEPPARGCPPLSPLPSGSRSGVAAAGCMWTFPPLPRPLCLWDEQCISWKPVMKGEGRAFVLGCEGLYSPPGSGGNLTESCEQGSLWALQRAG